MDRPKQTSDYKYAVRCAHECIGQCTALLVAEGPGPVIRCRWLEKAENQQSPEPESTLHCPLSIQTSYTADRSCGT